ncbi:MAG TPA: hypothetical protein PK867_31115, partial [Pirellulales bacterium]|nr:hypothetical protein [Pirellulales bacterium]
MFYAQRRAKHLSAARYRPTLEPLEQRVLLTIDLLGAPTWVEQGPGPILNTGGYGMDSQQNPAAGAINAIAPDPYDANVLYVATVNGGVWKTTDATNLNPTWTPLTDNLASLSMGCIAFSPLDTNTLYAGSARVSSYGSDGGPLMGLIKTTDGGSTWSVLASSTLANHQVTSVVPTALTTSQGQVVLVGTADDWGGNGGVFRSDDGGNTFVRMSGGASTGLPDAGVSQLVADPGNSLRFYAGVPGYGVYRSTDGGQTWTSIDNGLANLSGSQAIALAVHNDASTGTNAVYVSVSDNTLLGVYRSADQGNSWAPMDLPNAPYSYNQPHMAADPTDPNVVYVGTYAEQHFRGDASQPAGSQWTSVDGANAGNSAPHSDSRSLAFDANGNLLESDDGGIYRLLTPDDPATRKWQAVVGDLRITEMHWASYDSLNHTIFGGTQDNANPTQQSSGNLVWGQAQGGDGGFTQV